MWGVVRNARSAVGRPQRPGEEARPSTPATASLPSGDPKQVFLLIPDEFAEENAARTPTRIGSPGIRTRAARLAWYGGAGLLAGVGLLRLGSVVASPASRAPAEPGPAAPLSPRPRVDQVADTLALVTGAFDLRVRLFQSHQMRCPDLARGLVAVEERWVEYNVARAAIGAAQDSVHTALDRSLYASVDATERQFERSKCPRP